ncbi:MAG: deoxynucleoside kinase [Oscillospiraceae bacterium]|nr:deoxynucleoside kinase [Oscillospiraceae bacterium]
MGKLIVIDGLDGSGKTTQFEIIKGELMKSRNVKAISFPDYDNPSSALVKMYLNGDLSKDAGGVNAYAASSFYAVDRYASYKMFWEENYRRGDLIFASRYVSSNAIHQMSKLPQAEWDSYLDWLEDYEYTKLGLPKPDLVIFLDMPVELSQRLMTERYKGDESRKDIHETDFEYLKVCRRSALYAAEKLGWKIVECSSGGEPLSVESISGELLHLIKKVI